jgi:hypothetical protein
MKRYIEISSPKNQMESRLNIAVAFSLAHLDFLEAAVLIAPASHMRT